MKKNISQMKKKLWVVFSKYIRTRDKGICFICGKFSEGSAYHAGHFIPKSVGGLALYFNEENVHGCCYHCNINLGGNLYEYGQRLGDKTCKKLYQLKNESWKWDISKYQEMIKIYELKLKQLSD